MVFFTVVCRHSISGESSGSVLRNVSSLFMNYVGNISDKPPDSIDNIINNIIENITLCFLMNRELSNIFKKM